MLKWEDNIKVNLTLVIIELQKKKSICFLGFDWEYVAITCFCRDGVEQYS